MNTLTDKQWEVLQPLIPYQSFEKGGRPRANDRKTLNGIIWVLRTGAQWNELPKKYGSASTAWRRLKHWEETGVWNKIWKKLLQILETEARIDWKIHIIDGSFAPAKKGELKLDLLEKAKARR